MNKVLQPFPPSEGCHKRSFGAFRHRVNNNRNRPFTFAGEGRFLVMRSLADLFPIPGDTGVFLDVAMLKLFP